MSEPRDIFVSLTFTDENNLTMGDINKVIVDALNAKFKDVCPEIYRIDVQELSQKHPEHHEVKRHRP